MASIVMPAPANEALVAAFPGHQCAYCQSPIMSGERWVREKIFASLDANAPRYQRYHADLFGEEELSCWEKHLMAQEIAQRAERAA